MVYKTKTEKQTHELGVKLARRLKPGDVVALYGELGAGKTTFVQGVAQGLGVKTLVNSPTFVMIKPYGKFVHVDLYRVKSGKDSQTTGLGDYLYSPDHIVVIEWPGKIEGLLPENTKRIYFEIADETRRKITLD